jgi:signal transduction histidine kinase
MKLRARLVMTCMGMLVPVLLAVALANQSVHRRTMDALLDEQVDLWLEIGPGECLRAPGFALHVTGSRHELAVPPPEVLLGQGWGVPPPPLGPPPPGEPWALPMLDPLPPLWLEGYDEQLRPLSPGAQPLPPELVAEARRTGLVRRWVTLEGRPVRELLRAIRPLPDGCAWVLARRYDDQDPGVTRALAPWLLSGLLVPLVVGVAMGGPVSRLRALASAVRASAARRYRARTGLDGDDEIGLVARAFDEVVEELGVHIGKVEHREQVLRDFVADTTHDLMTPLSVLQGELAALGALAQGPEGAVALSRAAREAQYLSSLVHNLATAARLDTEAVSVHDLDLASLVERVVERHQPLAQRTSVSLACGVPADGLPLRGEAVLIEQAIGNLVHNALRYNRPQGHVAVTLDREGPQFVLRVRDDGPGLAPEQLPHLGQRHWRGPEARTRDPAGQGLGLAIARRVFERHDWSFSASSPPEGGLVIEVRGEA